MKLAAKAGRNRLPIPLGYAGRSSGTAIVELVSCLERDALYPGGEPAIVRRVGHLSVPLLLPNPDPASGSPTDFLDNLKKIAYGNVETQATRRKTRQYRSLRLT